ncbi:hypothetical protein [Candidatus Endomicrobiellum devescovinae]|jgi:hypothetical protein|uniref:hypothetical protein n=1 Tax=Candidatus Endomicrobiellum devescovinae TaxID=3242322 RepID=UPI00281A4EF5|nr:hypothetical protein [Endomicrobium sp.]
MKKILSLLLVMLLTSQMSFAVDGLRYDGTYETDVANETSVVPINDNGIALPTWFKVVLMTEAVLMCATIVGFSYCSSNNAPEVVDDVHIRYWEGIVARAVTSPRTFLVGHEQEFREALNGLDPTRDTAGRLVQRSRAFLSLLYPENVNFEQFVPRQDAFFGLFEA